MFRVVGTVMETEGKGKGEKYMSGNFINFA
jgi:hypothetical protein